MIQPKQLPFAKSIPHELVESFILASLAICSVLLYYKSQKQEIMQKIMTFCFSNFRLLMWIFDLENLVFIYLWAAAAIFLSFFVFTTLIASFFQYVAIIKQFFFTIVVCIFFLVPLKIQLSQPWQQQILPLSEYAEVMPYIAFSRLYLLTKPQELLWHEQQSFFNTTTNTASHPIIMTTTSPEHIPNKLIGSASVPFDAGQQPPPLMPTTQWPLLTYYLQRLSQFIIQYIAICAFVLLASSPMSPSICFSVLATFFWFVFFFVGYVAVVKIDVRNTKTHMRTYWDINVETVSRFIGVMCIASFPLWIIAVLGLLHPLDMLYSFVAPCIVVYVQRYHLENLYRNALHNFVICGPQSFQAFSIYINEKALPSTTITQLSMQNRCQTTIAMPAGTAQPTAAAAAAAAPTPGLPSSSPMAARRQIPETAYRRCAPVTSQELARRRSSVVLGQQDIASAVTTLPQYSSPVQQRPQLQQDKGQHQHQGDYRQTSPDIVPPPLPPHGKQLPHQPSQVAKRLPTSSHRRASSTQHHPHSQLLNSEQPQLNQRRASPGRARRRASLPENRLGGEQLS